MDKKTIQAFRKDFASTMKELESKYGAKISIGNVRFDDESFTTKLEVKELPKDGKSVQQADFEKLCASYGLKESDYMREFSFNGDTFKLIAIKTKAKKYPYVGLGSNEKRYKFPERALNSWNSDQ